MTRTLASKPCSKKVAEAQHRFLIGWSKGKPITRFADESCTFWKCGKWMTKIAPDEVSGMVKHGLAELNGNTLILRKEK